MLAIATGSTGIDVATDSVFWTLTGGDAIGITSVIGHAPFVNSFDRLLRRRRGVQKPQRLAAVWAFAQGPVAVRVHGEHALAGFVEFTERGE
jgi:hypothetical protein